MKRNKKGSIKVYHGFGHKQDMEIFGHVFRKLRTLRTKYSGNAIVNMLALFRLFVVKLLPDIPIQLIWDQQRIDGKTEYDGFFRLSWRSPAEVNAGWHEVRIISPAKRF